MAGLPNPLATNSLNTLGLKAAELSVHVVNQRGPVGNANVTLIEAGVRPPRSLITPDAGRAIGTVLFRKLIPGSYSVGATATNHVDRAVVALTLVPGQNAMTLTLEANEIIVVVTDTASPPKPLVKAAVTVSGSSTLAGNTDAQGTIHFVAVSTGAYSVTAQEDAHADVPPHSVTVSAGPTSTTILLPPYHLDVVVSDTETPPSLLATATVTAASSHALTSGTDGAGKAQFEPIVKGTYSVKATKEKHVVRAKSVTIGGAVAAYTVDLALPRDMVNPKITPATLVVVVKKFATPAGGGAKKPYTSPLRHELTLQTDVVFDGKGTFTCPNDKVAIFTAKTGGAEITFNGKDNVFSGTVLTTGVKVWVEGKSFSTSVNDVTAKLELTEGTKFNGPAATSTLTSVEVTLDICQARPAAGGDPPAFSQDDKVNVGRTVLVQNAAGDFDRAQLIIQPVKPPDFKCEVVLTAKNGALTAFLNERPTAGESGLLPHTIASDAIGSGDRLWVQGITVSNAMRDAGFLLGIKGIDDEGDKVNVTAIQLALDICQSRTTKAGDPNAMSAGDKVNVGRFVHEQDTNNHHGRALLVVRKVKPDKFDGALVLESRGALTELFSNEQPNAGEPVIAVPHTIDYKTEKNEDKKFWMQGKTVSGTLRDAGYVIHLKDDRTDNGDKVRVTVCKFSNLTADIPSTPARTNRLGNSPVDRHTYAVAGSTDHFDEDPTLNLPFALVEGSVLAIDDAHKILLAVQVAPAGTPVAWSVLRDSRPAPKGDHPNVAKLSGAPTLAQDGADPLKARMLANGVGTFHIRPFVDCNGSTRYEQGIDREPFLLMNMVLVRVQGKKNSSKANPTNAFAAVTGLSGGLPSAADGVLVRTGAQRTSSRPKDQAVHQIATITVIGGGGDGRRGLDMLFAGWVNNELSIPNSSLFHSSGPSNVDGEDVWSTYFDATFFAGGVPPSSTITAGVFQAFFESIHLRSSIFVPVGHAKVIHRGDPPPTTIGGPLLDTTNFGNEGTGGDSCVGTEGSMIPGPPRPIVKTDLPVGQEWTVQMWDSPGDSAPRTQGDFPGKLTDYAFNLDFRSDLVLWTNTTRSSGPSSRDPANRLYSTVQTNTWSVRLQVGFDLVTGDAFNPPSHAGVTLSKDSHPTRLAIPAETAGIETRGPIALKVLAIDRRF